MRRTFGAVALATVALTIVFIGSAGAAKPPTSNGGCPNGGTWVADPDVGASYSGTTTTTYFFQSWTARTGGLVGYCVYANQQATDVTADYASWTATNGNKAFSFQRSGGDKNNIPLDGAGINVDIGQATFDTAPTDQTILLHVNDPARCQQLYGGTATTCWVLPSPKPGPVCNAASASFPDTAAAYNNIPKDAVDCGPPSHAFEATQTKEFGNEVVLAKGGDIDTLKVLFNSYACEDFPAWYNSQCYTANPGDTFTHPITANIYAVGPSNTVGALLATTTVTQTIPYRPSADPTCVDAQNNPTGAYRNPVTNQCVFSIKKVLEFTGWTKTADYPQAGFSIGNHVIWTVEFATSTNGLTPTDSSQCTVPAGCPYDSLNVGTKTFPNAPYAGTEADSHAAFINSTWNGIYCDDGLGGTGSLRVSTNPPTPCTNTEATNNYAPDAWLGYTPLATIILLS